MIAAPRFQHWSSGGLALVVHGLFVVALVVSMSWKSLPHAPVQADLWASLPEPQPLEVAPAPAEEQVEPPPPDPVVQPRPPQATEADIALRKAEEEKQRREEELRREEEARKLEEARQEEARRQAEEKAQARARQEQEEMERAERERIERIKGELASRQAQQERARQAQAEQEIERAQAAWAAERRAQVVGDYKSRIQAKVQSYVRVPPRIVGNPEAEFQVTLFANGEVREVRLVKSSGQPTYDAEVERAILKASPLPLPNDREAAAEFRGGITMKFRPYPDGAASRR